MAIAVVEELQVSQIDQMCGCGWMGGCYRTVL